MLSIQYGERFVWDNEYWEYQRTDTSAGDLWFRNDAGRETFISPLALMIGFNRGTHRHDKAYKGGRVKKTAALLTQLSAFSASDIKIAWARRTYVMAILAAGIPKQAPDSWHPVIQAVKLPANFQRHPSWCTVQRWFHRFIASGQDIRSLIPNFKKRGRKSFFSTISQAQKNLIGEVMARYNERHLPTAETIYVDLKTEHDKVRKTQSYGVGWVTPSIGTVRRWIKNADQLTLLEKRFGKEVAKQQLKLQDPGYEAFDRLDVVEIDHTVADIMVIDEKGCNLGRPTVTIAIDAYTRMPVGVYVGFEPPSVYSVAMCLRDMMLPKTYLQTDYKLKVEWKAFGRPLVVLVDNAAEFKSEDFKNITGLLNIDVRIQPVGKPWFKGRVESFMNKIKYSRAIRTKGATIDIAHRRKAEYNPEDEACISLTEFRVSFLEWMLLEHAYEFHEEIMDVPARRWEAAVALRPLPLYSVDELDAILGHHDSALLTNKGLRYKSLFYKCQELQDLHYSAGSVELHFVSNPGNMGSIMVTLPNGEVVRAYCTYFEYASRMTLRQHERARAHARQQGKEWITQQDLTDAFIDMVDRSAMYLRRGKGGKQAARDLGIEYVSQPAHETDEPTLSPVTDLNWAVKHGNVNDPGETTSEPSPGPTAPKTGDDDLPMPKARNFRTEEAHD